LQQKRDKEIKKKGRRRKRGGATAEHTVIYGAFIVKTGKLCCLCCSRMKREEG
jgi:hypothetical protein